MSEPQPNQEERIISALTHSSVLIFGMGAIAAVVVWATQRDRSPYVALQALQSLIYQMVGFLVFVVSMCCWLALYFASFIPLMFAVDQGASEPPLYFIGAAALMLVPFAIMGLWTLGGLWAAVRTLQGQDFGYLVIGDRLKRWLAA